MTKEEILARISELDKKITKAEQNYNYYKAMQLAFKLVINGTYGAFANPHFVVSNKHIANAITAHGRDVILFMLDKIQNYFYNRWHLDKKTHKLLEYSYIVQEDIENGKYFMMQNDFKLNDRGYGDEVQEDGSIEYGLPKLLEFWGLTDNRLTNEDGRIVDIDGKNYKILYKRYLHSFENVRPIDGTKTEIRDESRYGTDDGTGMTYEYFHNEDVVVYGDTDSLYVTFEPIMQSCEYKGDGLEFILTFDRFYEEPFHKRALKEYSDPYGVNNLHDFELETVNKSSLHIAKKMYLNNVVWEDGIFYEDMEHFYPKGIDIVRSSTPAFVRGKKQKGGVWDFIDYLFKNPENLNIKDILKIMKNLKKQFIMAGSADIDSVSMNCSVNKYKEKVHDDVNHMHIEKGSHFSVKAAMFHNYLLNKNPEYLSLYSPVKSNKVKWYFCKSRYQLQNGEKYEAAERLAYLRSFHPTELMMKEGVEVDWDTMFEKSMLKIVNSFLEPIGLPEINKRLSVLNSLFGGAFLKKSQELKKEEEKMGTFEVNDPTIFNEFDDFNDFGNNDDNEFNEFDFGDDF